jgi:hypothetical protein
MREKVRLQAHIVSERSKVVSLEKAVVGKPTERLGQVGVREVPLHARGSSKIQPSVARADESARGAQSIPTTSGEADTSSSSMSGPRGGEASLRSSGDRAGGERGQGVREGDGSSGRSSGSIGGEGGGKDGRSTGKGDGLGLERGRELRPGLVEGWGKNAGSD